MGYFDDSLDSWDSRCEWGVRHPRGGVVCVQGDQCRRGDGLFYRKCGTAQGSGPHGWCAVGLFSVVGTWIILKLVDAVLGLRVSSEDGDK